MKSIREIITNGLWRNNPALSQLLGLCPLLAVTTNASYALGLGLTTTLVLAITNLIISISRFWIATEIRIPIYMIVISSVVSCMQMLFEAYSRDLYQALGVFIPLIVTNCIVIGRAEMVASKSGILISTLDGLAMGVGATFTMVTLGIIREIIGSGTIFDGADHLFGAWAHPLRVEIFNFDSPLLLAVLPPGAFIGLGLLIALKNLIEKK